MIEGRLITTKPGIYYFRNQINGKYYIGQAINLKTRFKSHMGNYKCHRYDNPLYRAFDKYGLEAFEYNLLEVIEEELNDIDLKLKLDSLEKEYIQKFNSYKNGYNQTLGGDAGVLGYKFTEEQLKAHKKRGKKIAEDGRYRIFVYDKQEDKYHEFMSLVDAAEKLNLNAGGLRAAKSKNRWYLNRYYANTSKEVLQDIVNNGNTLCSKNRHSYKSENHEYLVEYYNYLKQFKTVSIKQVCQDLGLKEDAIKKRNKKLRELGYTDLPFNSHNIIKYIEMIDVVDNKSGIYKLKELSELFQITETSMRKQIKRANLYKNRYKFKIVYES